MLHALKQKTKQLFGLSKPDQNREKLANLYYLVLARTGVATSGAPRLVSVIPSPFVPMKEGLLLQTIASVEKQAGHPFAAAILTAAEDRGLTLATPRSFEYLPGLGIEVYLGDKKIHVGNRNLMDEKLVQIDAMQEKIEKLLDAGNVVLFVAVDGVFVGIAVLEHDHNQAMQPIIQRLHGLGISVALMTSDHKQTAQNLADKLGIQRIIAEVRAEDKPTEIAKLLRDDQYVAKLGTPTHHMPAFQAADLAVLHGEGDHREFDLQVENLEHLLSKIQKARRIV